MFFLLINTVLMKIQIDTLSKSFILSKLSYLFGIIYINKIGE